MSSEIELWCWVQGDDLNRVFLANIEQSATVTHLKRAIHTVKPLFRQIKPVDLELWKFELPLLNLNNDSANRIELTDPSLGVIKLISDLWKEQPPQLTLSVILRRPAGTITSPSSSLEGKFSDESKKKFEDLTVLWATFWGKPAPQCFIKHTVKIPDSRTLVISEKEMTYTYLSLPDGNMFPCDLSQILVTETYMSFYNELCREDLRWLHYSEKPHSHLSTSHSTVITGQPGIGGTTCLSYILVRRLQEKKPTVYCDQLGFAYVYTHAGVQKVPLGNHCVSALESVSCCGLITIHPGMSKILWQFHPSQYRGGRVVVATSPNPTHVTAFKECDARTYTLPTWKWDDVYCVSFLIRDGPPTGPDDKRLLDLFTMFRGIPQRVFQALFNDEEELEQQ